MERTTTRKRNSANSVRRKQRLAAPLLVVALAVVTGFALLAAGLTLSAAPTTTRSGEHSDSDVLALAADFYDRINDLLNGQDETLLDTIVADELIEHPRHAGAASGRAAFAERLRQQRAAFPGIQLAVEHLELIGDDSVLATIAVRGVEASATFGLTTSDVAVRSRLEVLRIRGGRVVERWSGDPEPLLIEPLAELSFDALRGDWSPWTALDLLVQRITIESGASFETPVDGGARVVLTDEAKVKAIPLAIDDASRERPDEWDLTAESPLVIGKTERARFRNDGSRPARLLVIVIRPTVVASPVKRHGRSQSPSPTPANDNGVTRETIAVALGVRIPQSQRLRLGRARVGPAVRLTTTPETTTLIAAVELGAIDVSSLTSGLWVTRNVNAGLHITGLTTATLEQGDGFQVEQAAAVEIRVADGATLLLLTLEPTRAIE